MGPERTAQTYGPGITAASKTVLVELMTLLRAYRDSLVLVGGWVPYLLLERHRRPDDAFVHVGSIDIDLAVDPATVNEPQYATIVELLTERGYRPAPDRRGLPIPNSFERIAPSPITNKRYPIRVDFLTPQQDGRAVRSTPLGTASRAQSRDAARRPHLPVQEDLLARKIKGCEAAFSHQTRVEVTGTLPDGGRLTVPIPMADLVALLTMKGIVLGERYREKDAYDLYALIAHYGRGPRDVAAVVRPHVGDPLVHEAMTAVRTAFASRESSGPAWAASFMVNPVFAAERERLITDAFMVVNEFLAHLFAPEPPAR